MTEAKRKTEKAILLKRFTEKKFKDENIPSSPQPSFNQKRKNRYIFNSNNMIDETPNVPRLMERRKSYDSTSKQDSFALLARSHVQQPLTPKPMLRRNDTADIVQVLNIGGLVNKASASHGELPDVYKLSEPKRQRSSFSILPPIEENGLPSLHNSKPPPSRNSRFRKKKCRLNPKVKDDLCLELRTEQHRERRLSLNRINDLEATERRIDFFQKIVLKRFGLIRGKMRKKLREHYETLIVKRSQQREYLIRKQRFVQDMKEAKKKRGIGPWELLWEYKQEIIKRDSPYADFPSYRIRQVVVKGGDDLRQEMVAMQVIRKVKEIFAFEKTQLYVYAYDIIAIDSNSGALGNIQSDSRIHSRFNIYRRFKKEISRQFIRRNILRDVH